MHHSFGMRKTITLFLFFAIFVSAVAAQASAYETVTRNGNKFYKYKVQSGEGLYAISRTFKVTVADILKHNPGTDSGLKNGQELLIPVSETAAPASARTVQQPPQSPANQNHTFRHTVARGETLYGISRMYNTSIDEIKRYNPGLTQDISEGQVVVVPQQRILVSNKDENYRYHTISAKETLYSVSRTYSLKPEDLVAVNPGLSEKTFLIGKTIRVPFFQSNADFVPYSEQTQNLVHRVQRGETLYSISRAYDVSQAEIEKMNPMLAAGMKVNMELIIPVKAARLDENVQAQEQAARRLLNQSKESQKVDVINVGLLLPFLDKTSDQHLRFQEYYEGFLLAVKKMRDEGANINVYVFEIGSKAKLESLLETLEMQSLNLLIGGMTDAQIKTLSDFSNKYSIKYVVPFSSKNNEVQNSSNMFQVNSPHSYLYSKASGVFMDNFRKSNVVIVNVPGRSDKADFISILKSDLKKNNTRYKEITLTSNLETDLAQQLQAGGENVIVPSTGDSGALRDIMQALDKVRQSQSGLVTRLFGYPEWQTFNNDLKSSMHKFGTYFYSTFYVDDKDSATRSFVDEFKRWYGRNLINTTPKYGMFGYDTGLYFLTAIHRFGNNFEQQLDRMPTNYIQFAFNFERVNNWGGFINTGLFLIHYDANKMIYKINKSR